MTARARLWLDLGLFGALFLGYNPAWTGVAVHEWLCVITLVPLLFHVVVNWDQTLAILRRFAEIVRATPKVNLVVDAALFVAAVTVMLSGLLISQSVARVFGIAIVPSALWVSTHSWSADATILLLLVHFALHWRWIANVAGKLGRTRPHCSGRPRRRHPPRDAASRDATARRQAVRHGARPQRRALPALTPRPRRTMKNLSRNTAAVLVLTLFTGLAVFSAIQLGGRLFGTSTASAQTVTSQAATSQSSGSAQSADEYYYDDGTSGSSQSSGTTDPYGYGELERIRQLEQRPDLHLPGHGLYRIELPRDAVTRPDGRAGARARQPSCCGRGCRARARTAGTCGHDEALRVREPRSGAPRLSSSASASVSAGVRRGSRG